jgi:endonuclease YncB( thermonuclease family)
MKKIVVAVFCALAIFYAGSAWAIIFLWQDDKGVMQISDSLAQVPKEFRELVIENGPDKKEQGNVGYWRDSNGNFHFVRVNPAPSAKKEAPLTPKKIEQIEKTSYDPESDMVLRGKPNPEVLTARVQKVLSPSTIQLSNGEKLRFQGIGFPSELAPGSMSYQSAMTYEKGLLQGKTVKILFDKKKKDAEGVLLGEVFMGTEMFVNGDLVLKGYAQVRTEAPNLEYMKLYRKLEDNARKTNLGIWQEISSK